MITDIFKFTMIAFVNWSNNIVVQVEGHIHKYNTRKLFNTCDNCKSNDNVIA